MSPTLNGTPVETHSITLPKGSSTVVTSASFTPDPGDLLVVKAGTWSSQVSTTAISGGGWLWSLKDQTAAPTGDASNASIYTAQVGLAAAAMTVSVTFTVTTAQHAANGMGGFVIERWATATMDAIPDTEHVVGVTTTSSSITPTTAGSVISWIDVDYNGAAGTATYLAGATQTALWQQTPNISIYTAYEPASSTSPLTYGMSSPTGQFATMAAIEILPVTTFAGAASLAGVGAVTASPVIPATRINQFFPVMPC